MDYCSRFCHDGDNEEQCILEKEEVKPRGKTPHEKLDYWRNVRSRRTVWQMFYLGLPYQAEALVALYFAARHLGHLEKEIRSALPAYYDGMSQILGGFSLSGRFSMETNRNIPKRTVHHLWHCFLHHAIFNTCEKTLHLSGWKRSLVCSSRALAGC